MQKIVIALASLLAFPFMGMKAASDPNFHIYLCFGQSNMEGNANWETVDNEYVDPRFQMLATTNFDNPYRTLGNWYTAKCPIVSPAGRLGPTDYFGRTMVAALPANVKVGVVAVAMGGSPIEMFDKDKYAKKLSENPTEWWATLAKNYYGGNPYQRLIDMAKKAQQSGVIKGILLHQGCSNCGDPNWPGMVKKIYEDMLSDLGLLASDVPLFVGETEREDMGGGCAGHNAVVAKVPQVIPTAHVVSSEGLPGNGIDPWHFSAAGYRTFGKRYAVEALKVMGLEQKVSADYSLPDNMRKFLTLTKIEPIDEVQIRVGGTKQLTVWGVFADGHREILTRDATFSSTDFAVTQGLVSATTEKTGTVTVTYVDFTGAVHQLPVTVKASDLGPNHYLVVDNGAPGSNLWDKQAICTLNAFMVAGKTYVVKAEIKAENSGDCGLWPIWSTSPNKNQWGGSDDVQYLAAYTLTPSFKQFTWEFSASFPHDKLQFAFGLIGGKVYFDNVSCVEKGTDVEMVANGDFESDNASNWEVISWANQTKAIEEDNTAAGISVVSMQRTEGVYYNLRGQRIAHPVKGLYIVNGKKLFVK